MKTIEVIARALIVKNDRILLCKTVGDGNHFLPGGHVEFGESTETTLAREMTEEAAEQIENLKYIGIFQNTYNKGEESHHEINIIYTAEIKNDNVVSRESHISFEWIPLQEFTNIKFLPKIFQDEIEKHVTSTNLIYLSSISD